MPFADSAAPDQLTILCLITCWMWVHWLIIGYLTLLRGCEGLSGGTLFPYGIRQISHMAVERLKVLYINPPDKPMHPRCLTWELHCLMISQLYPILQTSGQCSYQIRLRRCSGLSGATQSKYDILSAPQGLNEEDHLNTMHMLNKLSLQ